MKELRPTYSETDWQSERTWAYLLRNRLTEWKNSGLLTQKQTDRVKELGSTYSETEWQSERTQAYLPWNRPTEWKNSDLLTRNRLTEWKNSDLLTQKQIDRVKELGPTYSETDWQNADLLTQKHSRWQSREYSKLPYTNLYSVNVVSFKLWGSAVCVCKYSP